MIYVSKYMSPVGKIMLASDEDNIVGLWIAGQRHFASGLGDNVRSGEDISLLIRAKRWLDAYFARERPDAGALPLSPGGSDFRQSVWDILRRIPYGETVTYGDIANELAKLRGCRMSAQAVGGAVGHNPISIIIPCHRVVGADGSLTGYAGGIDVKVKLLTHEGVDMSHFYVPEKGTAL